MLLALKEDAGRATLAPIDCDSDNHKTLGTFGIHSVGRKSPLTLRPRKTKAVKRHQNRIYSGDGKY
jgi:hypothetical protein